MLDNAESAGLGAYHFVGRRRPHAANVLAHRQSRKMSGM
jgi:hypothetical protein